MDAASVGTLITILTPVVIPLLVRVLKSSAARRKWILPVSATVLGVALDVLNGLATGNSVGPIWGAALGAASVGLREIVDQLRK